MLNLLQNLRWQDIVDIVLLTIIFYRIIILIKGTRTIPMLTGFILLMVLYLVAQLFQLDAMGLLLDHIANSLVLVLVILFQSDIRNALAQFGLITFFTGGPRKQDIIDEVIQGSLMMSRKRIGALIVFEREVGLRNFIDKGTSLDCECSKELLQSIFHPTSPLHDGAVIIDRKGRIAAAKCLLPISMSTKLSPVVGTRHRAAVGLTEETDAVVLVISEERSEVSISFGGELKRDTDENLKQLIIELLEGKRTELIKSPIQDGTQKTPVPQATDLPIEQNIN